MSDLLTMSQTELSRLELIQRVETHQLKQQDAARQLGLSVRQFRRLSELFQDGGAAALISKKRGRPSNNQLNVTLKKEVRELLKSRYSGFGPTLAHEKLAEEHGLHLSLEALRQLMIQNDLWKARRARKPVVHQMRERRACFGELVQIDGSPHDWFEDRGPRSSLLVFIDDATGAVQHLQFVATEDTWSYFEATRCYIERHGKPVAFYSDKHGIFRPNAKENLAGAGITQFGRALQQLDIALICANTPQAKGRVERMNQTLQDRLVKELRLRNICDRTAANLFLPDFVERLNRRFKVSPRIPHDAHRPLRPREVLDQILALQSTRKLSKNLSFQYEKVIYQIQTARPTYALRQARIDIFQDRQGQIKISYKGKNLDFTVHHLQPRQGALVDSKSIDQHFTQNRKPPPTLPLPLDHPFRRYAFPRKYAPTTQPRR